MEVISLHIIIAVQEKKMLKPCNSTGQRRSLFAHVTGKTAHACENYLLIRGMKLVCYILTVLIGDVY